MVNSIPSPLVCSPLSLFGCWGVWSCFEYLLGSVLLPHVKCGSGLCPTRALASTNLGAISLKPLSTAWSTTSSIGLVPMSLEPCLATPANCPPGSEVAFCAPWKSSRLAPLPSSEVARASRWFDRRLLVLVARVSLLLVVGDCAMAVELYPFDKFTPKGARLDKQASNRRMPTIDCLSKKQREALPVTPTHFEWRERSNFGRTHWVLLVWGVGYRNHTKPWRWQSTTSRWVEDEGK